MLKTNVSTLAPQVSYGYKPDKVRDVVDMAGTPVDQVYIGSCTNGRIEDLRVVAAIVRGRKIAETVRAIFSSTTPQIYSQTLDEGLIKIFMDSGFCVTNRLIPRCGEARNLRCGLPSFFVVITGG